MKNFEKNLIESAIEIKEMAIEASKEGWTIKLGDKRLKPIELEGEARQAFEEVRAKIKKVPAIFEKIRKEYTTSPKDITFKGDGTAHVHGDDGKFLGKIKLSKNYKF